MSRWEGEADNKAYDKLFDEVNLDAVSQDAMSESQEELLGIITMAPTSERGVVTVAGTTVVAIEGEGSGKEGGTGGHSSRELPTTLAHEASQILP